MPKLVCIHCQTELRKSNLGTLVIETADMGEPDPSPYKVWSADTFQCPGCGFEVVADFCERPMREDHYAKDFPAWLKTRKAAAKHIVYDHEKTTNGGA